MLYSLASAEFNDDISRFGYFLFELKRRFHKRGLLRYQRENAQWGGISAAHRLKALRLCDDVKVLCGAFEVFEDRAAQAGSQGRPIHRRAAGARF